MLIVGTFAGLIRGRASGGACEFLTRATPSVGNHLLPVFLPDGRHFLYLRNGPGDLVAGSLDAAPGTAPKSLLKIRQGQVDYVQVPGSPGGRLLFVRDSTLFAQPFDPERLEFAGDAVPLAGGIGTLYANAHFSASTNGRLVYRTADSSSVQLTWFDRQGRAVAEVGEPVFPSALWVSPDGRRVVYGSLVPPYGLMSMDLSRGTNSRLNDLSTDAGVAWSADGERIVFAARDGMHQRVLNGAADQQMLLPSAGVSYMTGLVMDGSSFMRQSILEPDDASCRRCGSMETESLSRLDPQVPSSGSRPTVAGSRTSRTSPAETRSMSARSIPPRNPNRLKLAPRTRSFPGATSQQCSAGGMTAGNCGMSRLIPP